MKWFNNPVNYSYAIRILIRIGILTLFYSCAQQGMPLGGPEDHMSPEVVRVFPEPGGVRVKTRADIQIYFSKPMDQLSVEEGIFIHPSPQGKKKMSWKGQRLRIHFYNNLDSNTSYVITIGAQGQDLHRNHLKQSVTIAFSTGDSIEKGEIGGRIWKTPHQGERSAVSLFAYRLESKPAPNPAQDPADYVTQTGRDGTYRFYYLARQRFRIFAVGDKNKSNLYDIDSEPVGIPTVDVDLHQNPHYDGLNFTLALGDTTPPMLQSGKAIHQNLIEIKFNEPMDSATVLDLKYYNIFTVGPDSGVKLEINEIYYQNSPPSYHLSVGSQKPRIRYKLIIQSGVKDEHGNPLSVSKNNIYFPSIPIPDTVAPEITDIRPRTGKYFIDSLFTMRLFLSEPLLSQTLETGCRLVTGLGDVISGKINQETPVRYRLSFKTIKMTNPKINFVMDPKLIKDRMGNPVAGDSVLQIEYQLFPESQGGILRGEIQNETTPFSGKIHVNVMNLKGDVVKFQLLNETGLFTFSGLPSDRYQIYSFIDSNQDGRLGLGQIQPFLHAEKEIYLQDTLSVRERWETTGVKMVFKN